MVFNTIPYHPNQPSQQYGFHHPMNWPGNRRKRPSRCEIPRVFCWKNCGGEFLRMAKSVHPLDKMGQNGEFRAISWSHPEIIYLQLKWMYRESSLPFLGYLLLWLQLQVRGKFCRFPMKVIPWQPNPHQQSSARCTLNLDECYPPRKRNDNKISHQTGSWENRSKNRLKKKCQKVGHMLVFLEAIF